MTEPKTPEEWVRWGILEAETNPNWFACRVEAIKRAQEQAFKNGFDEGCHTATEKILNATKLVVKNTREDARREAINECREIIFKLAKKLHFEDKYERAGACKDCDDALAELLKDENK